MLILVFVLVCVVATVEGGGCQSCGSSKRKEVLYMYDTYTNTFQFQFKLLLLGCLCCSGGGVVAGSQDTCSARAVLAISFYLSLR